MSQAVQIAIKSAQCDRHQVRPKLLAMKSAIVAILLFISTALFAQDKPGAICVAPIPHEPPSTAGTPELLLQVGELLIQD